MVAPLIKMKILNNISYNLWMEIWVDQISPWCRAHINNYFGLDMCKSQFLDLIQF
jgi:hypothetical protein